MGSASQTQVLEWTVDSREGKIHPERVLSLQPVVKARFLPMVPTKTFLRKQQVYDFCFKNISKSVLVPSSFLLFKISVCREADGLFLDLTFCSEPGSRGGGSSENSHKAGKKGVAEHQFLRKTQSYISPSSSPHKMIPLTLPMAWLCPTSFPTDCYSPALLKPSSLQSQNTL